MLIYLGLFAPLKPPNLLGPLRCSALLTTLSAYFSPLSLVFVWCYLCACIMGFEHKCVDCYSVFVVLPNSVVHIFASGPRIWSIIHKQMQKAKSQCWHLPDTLSEKYINLNEFDYMLDLWYQHQKIRTICRKHFLPPLESCYFNLFTVKFIHFVIYYYAQFLLSVPVYYLYLLFRVMTSDKSWESPT